MAYNTKTGLRDYGKIHLALGYVALVSFVLLMLVAFGALDSGYRLIGTTFAVLSIVLMFGTRKSDEWIESLWSAGANAGFVGAMFWLMFAPYLEGFFDGLFAIENGQDFPISGASEFALGCFLAAFNLKRVRGY